MNLLEQLKNSEFETLVFCREGWCKTTATAKVCVVECAKDFRVPPPEIASIETIKKIRFENFYSLDVSAIFTTLAEMPNLEEIYFYHSEIKNIPPQIGLMKNLKRLTFDTDVSGSIKSWEMKPAPPEFGELENLQEITFINCTSFRKGLPLESANLHNLKRLNFTDTYALSNLPENIPILPNLEYLYFSGVKIQSSELELILAASKTLKTVAIKDTFYRFAELAEKYPHIEFYNNGVKFGAELSQFQNAPENLPEIGEWLKTKRSEAENAQYAYLLMKKYFERVGLKLKKSEVPAMLYSFNLEFYANVHLILREPKFSAMLKRFFAELVDFYEAFSGEFFAYNLLGLLENFIDRDPPRSFIVPLLPPKALAQFSAVDEILDQQHEDYIERLNQMGY